MTNNIKKQKNDSLTYITQAEIHYHWAILQFHFGYEKSAVFSLKKSYDILQKSKKKYPKLSLNNKLDGIFNILLDQIPENYKWVFDILGYKGNSAFGFKILLKNNNNLFNIEQNITLNLLQIHFQEKKTSTISLTNSTEIEKLTSIYIYNKNKNLTKALELIENATHQSKINIYNYLIGEIYLKQGKFNKSILYFLTYIAHNKGNTYLKAAHLNLYYAYFLLENNEKATSHFQKINNTPISNSEKDKHAQNSYSIDEKLNAILLKSRLLYDGGNYKEALNELNNLVISNLLENEKIEFYYRKARIYQSLGQKENAEKFYLEVLNNSKKANTNVFYAAQSALELGIIYIPTHTTKAAEYLNIAINFKNHSYENAIEIKAKTLLKEIKQ